MVAVVLKNGDFTEGRGPMILHKVFSTREKAREYVSKQEGIFGSRQYTKAGTHSTRGTGITEEHWNGYSIQTMPVDE